MKIKKTIFVIAALTTALLIPAGTASAATEQDVINAARANGWPESTIQNISNSISGGEYSSEDYDKMVAQMIQYDKQLEEEILKALGIAASDNEQQEEENNSSGSGSSNEEDRKTDKAFVDMTLDEKKAYINSMTESERQAFLNSLTTEEKNSLIKQMSISQKAELVDSFKDILAEFGINISIDQLTQDDIKLSAVDNDGKLIGISSMSMTVDPTGTSRAIPIIGGTALILFSAAGIAFLVKGKTSKKEIL